MNGLRSGFTRLCHNSSATVLSNRDKNPIWIQPIIPAALLHFAAVETVFMLGRESGYQAVGGVGITRGKYTFPRL